MQWSRRKVLQTGVSAGVSLVGSSLLFAPAKLLASNASVIELIQKSSQFFQHGIASGDPLSDRVILWTRISQAQGDILVRYQVAMDPLFQNLVLDDVTSTNAARDFTVKVDAPVPVAGRSYYYRFAYDGIWSMVGRTKSATTAADNVRLAVVSCSSVWSGQMHSYDRIADRNDLDLVLHCGDYIYDYPDEDEILFPSPDSMDMQRPRNLAEMRRRYAYYRKDRFLRRAHQQHPFSIIWDNHDIAIKGPKEEALQAFHEWTPTRESPRGIKYIYRQLAFGGLVDLTLLDTRYIGRGSNIAGTEDKSILGDEQYEWLKERLGQSQAQWRLIGNQVMLAPFKILGQSLSESLWDGFPKERDRLLRFLDEAGIDNTVVLTGDAHMSFASHLEYKGRRVAVEFLPTSVSRGNVDEEIKGFLGRLAGEAAKTFLPLFNPHIKYAENVSNGYGIVDITSDRCRCEFWYTNIQSYSTEQRLAKVMETRSGENRWRSVLSPEPSIGLDSAIPAPEEQQWFVRSPAFGGPHGTHFDDERSLGYRSQPTEVSLRGGARVDHVGIKFTDGTVLSHGGQGGSLRRLQLAADERIRQIEIFTDKKGGHTRVFYLRYTTNLNQSVAVGRKSGRRHLIDIPDGWQVVGFFGRSGTEMDLLGHILSRWQ